jgi:hypothetical protein
MLNPHISRTGIPSILSLILFYAEVTTQTRSGGFFIASLTQIKNPAE